LGPAGRNLEQNSRENTTQKGILMNDLPV
jgi:hypothetical protein